MNKLAAYAALLEDHPLWNKEADGDFEGRRWSAALAGSIPGLLPVSTAISASTAAGGRGMQTAAGQFGGAVGGAVLGYSLGRSEASREMLGLLGTGVGGGLGAYLAHGGPSERAKRARKGD